MTRRGSASWRRPASCAPSREGETGLDQDEVRHWPSWCRHRTRSLLAHVWLASIPSQAEAQAGAVLSGLASSTVPEVRRLLAVALPLPPRRRLAWSWWRRAKRWRAR
ncbi:MAG TPA: hypothetical protein VFD01_22145 [Candidatus Dormibacteraeota bacterium]|nr:hypothetical protein [Candidatus Dormibacteraeota bacterium]